MNNTISLLTFRKWLILIAILIVGIVFVGGVTRLTHSGLSMVKWQPILGILPPLTHAQWETVFDAYKQFPEYQKLRYGMTLFEFKKIFFWEYLHRVLARILGLILLVPFLWLSLRNRLTYFMKNRLLVMIGLVLLQGFVGWYMVKSGLVDRPDVSHYRLALHLSLAFFLFQYVMWTFWEAGDVDEPEEYSGYIPSIQVGIGILVVVILQLIYGAFVAGLDAGFGYNTFPKMNGYWIPPTAGSMQPFWHNFFANPVTVQWVHRMLAFWLVVRVFMSGFLIFRSQNRGLIVAFYLLCFAIAVQIILGILTLIYVVPLPLAVLHQLGGLMVLTATVYLLFMLKRFQEGRE